MGEITIPSLKEYDADVHFSFGDICWVPGQDLLISLLYVVADRFLCSLVEVVNGLVEVVNGCARP